MTAPGHDHGASPASDGAAASMRGGLVEFATRRRVTIAMCTVTLLLFGLIALGNLKKLMRQCERNDLRGQLALEAQLFRECAGTADFVEGLAAFLGKREARFEGR